MAGSLFYEASYGGVRLDIATLDGDLGRALAEHRPARGDGAVVQDRGRNPRRATCALLWIAHDDADDPLGRYRAFLELAHRGEPALFSHPIHGAYRVLVGDIRESLDHADPDVLAVTCELVEAGQLDAVADAGDAAVDGVAGPEELAATVGTLALALESGELSSPTPRRALEASERWATAGRSAGVTSVTGEADALSPRDVLLELGSVLAELADEAERLELATRLDRYSLYRDMQLLHRQLVRAADAATATTARLFSLSVAAPTPLRAIVTATYGAHAAEERLREVMQLNAIRTPAAVPAGTVLRMPAPAHTR